VVDPLDGEWWGDMYGLTRPSETFYRDPLLRAVRRSISRHEVRHDEPAALADRGQVRRDLVAPPAPGPGDAEREAGRAGRSVGRLTPRCGHSQEGLRH
jgi:hypothetical protein